MLTPQPEYAGRAAILPLTNFTDSLQHLYKVFIHRWLILTKSLLIPLHFCILIKSLDMNASILLVTSKTIETSTYAGYVVGTIIALFILAYLIYTLIKPEKF
jgi:K+-transporting ATPase KdpF subunit